MNATLRVNVLILGDVQISVTYGQEPSHQCLHNNDDVTLTCTVNPLTTLIIWSHYANDMVTCSSTNDDQCIPAAGTSYTRHLFSSVVSNGEFSLRINPVSPGTDAGVYTCEHGGASDSASVTLTACGKSPLYFTRMSLFQVKFISVYHMAKIHLTSVFTIMMMSH